MYGLLASLEEECKGPFMVIPEPQSNKGQQNNELDFSLRKHYLMF